MWDRLWINLNVATMVPGTGPYGIVNDAALGIDGERIVYCGRVADLPDKPETLATVVEDMEGRWATPGLIDCHTHLVHGGDRAGEFELRLNGASYEELHRADGGILSTVRATRAATLESLVNSAIPRLDSLLREGVTTVEIKSGYGLDAETECTMLRAAKHLAIQRPVNVTTTFLGAHALPPEFHARKDDYIDLVCTEMLPQVADEGLADAVDGFCESVAFNPEQIARVFAVARHLGLPVKLHAEQLSDTGGAIMAAKFNALSCDHLEYLSPSGAAAMAASGSVAVLLPGAFYFLGDMRPPPVELLRQMGIPIAVATDCNPGSSPATSILLMLNMATVLFRLTPEEALAGATREAARALGMASDRGTIEAGKIADIAVWNMEHPRELSYHIGFNPIHRVLQSGQPGAVTRNQTVGI